MLSRVNRHWLWPAVVIAVLAFAVAGYSVLPGRTPDVAQATPVRSGPFEVTVKGLGSQAPLALSDPANHWIVVVARVELTATRSWPGLPVLLRLPDVTGLVSQEPQVYLVRDGSTGGPLQPGLPEDLAYCWEQRAGTPAPTQAKVDIGRYVALAQNPAGQQQWAPAGTAAIVTAASAKPEPKK
jgi:hypothetical protein